VELPPADAGGEDDVSLSAMVALPTIREMEDRLIAEALKRTGGNQTMASRMLGITRQTLNRRLKQATS
jgi:DNA-binding protein Fis